MSQMKQSERVLAYMKQGFPLTSLEALEKLGIISFPKRICELRKQGYNIAQKRITVKNRYGNKLSVNEYWLVDDEK